MLADWTLLLHGMKEKEKDKCTAFIFQLILQLKSTKVGVLDSTPLNMWKSKQDREREHIKKKYRQKQTPRAKRCWSFELYFLFLNKSYIQHLCLITCSCIAVEKQSHRILKRVNTHSSYTSRVLCTWPKPESYEDIDGQTGCGGREGCGVTTEKGEEQTYRYILSAEDGKSITEERHSNLDPTNKIDQ